MCKLRHKVRNVQRLPHEGQSLGTILFKVILRASKAIFSQIWDLNTETVCP